MIMVTHPRPETIQHIFKIFFLNKEKLGLILKMGMSRGWIFVRIKVF